MKEYIKEKLHVLEELHIGITDEQKTSMSKLKTEIAIDNFCRPLIMGGYEEYGAKYN